MKEYDIVIIGGGVGGLVTSAGASQLGARVALVEKDSLGGDCLHYGCVPTKRLVHSAKVANTVRNAAAFGVNCDNVTVDFKAVMEGVRGVQAKIARHDDPERFRKMGVDVVFGKGKFTSPHTFEVNGEKLSARSFLIATGSKPVTLPIPGLADSKPLTNISALALEDLPKSIIILGAGPIGMEFGQIYHRLGSKVIIIEKFDQILPREDRDLSNELHKILGDEGMEIHTCTEVKEVSRAGGKVKVSASCSEGPTEYEADEILMAIGRSPNVEGLGLEAAGVKFDSRTGITVNDKLQTSAAHIYACGDVSGPYPFTHVAEYQAGIVITNALFPVISRRADYRVVPWVTYVDPELARVGMTEAEAIEKYGKDGVKVYRFDFKDVDRAVIEDEAKGLIKLVVDKKLRILGAHILGPHAGELLQEYVLAMKKRLPITDISQTIHPYPTLAQGLKRAPDQYYREKLFTGWMPKLTRWLIRKGD